MYTTPVKLANGEGSLDSWNKSAHSIVIDQNTLNRWLRITRQSGYYDVRFAAGVIEEPQWKEPFEVLLERALNVRRIDSLNHPLVKKLHGRD